MKIRPLLDRVLLKPTEAEEKTAGGIYIPATAQEKTQEAKVVAVGDDKEKIKVSVGDTVIYDKYAGTQIKINSEEHLIVKASDIIAVIE
ncbi:MAG: co-chaperone GroES [Spirochaetaceae bacterium]|nr:co-chaperone GroES [Spirochaetaceae bacterium]